MESYYGAFWLDEGTVVDLPVLQSMLYGSHNLMTNSTLNVPSLISLSGSMTIDKGATLNAPEVVTLNGLAVNLQEGGTLYAPKAQEFSSSSVTLTPNRSFITGVIHNIDNSCLIWARERPGEFLMAI